MRGYAGIARPLYEATDRTAGGGTRKFEWSEEKELAFRTLKKALITAPVLSTPEEGNEEFILHCDASKFAIGSVLSQMQEWFDEKGVSQGKKERVIAYHSRKLTGAETRYAAYDRELLALKESMLAWRFFTQGYHVTVHTDHRSLEQILKQKTLSSRQFGALVALANFNYDIKYIKGASNIVADRLSRRPDHDSSTDTVFLLQELDLPVPAERGTTPVTEAFMSVVEEAREDGREGWLDTIRKAYAEDDWFGPVLAVLQGTELSQLSPAEVKRARVRAARFKLVDGLLVLREGERLAVPNVGRLRLDLCSEHHDTPLGGHFGRERTGMALRKRYFWPRLSRMVAGYVRGCDVCHRVKPSNEKPFGELEQLAIPEERWSRIGIDFITKLPRSANGNDCVVSVIDHLTKRAHFWPAKEGGLTSEAFAGMFCRKYVSLHGVPDVIVSDQDARFVSEFWRSLMRTLGVKMAMSSAYHPQTDGQTEKVNHVIGTYLRAFSRHDPDRWDEILPLGEFAYNSSVHAATGSSPFELDLGYTPRMPVDVVVRAAVGTGTGRRMESGLSFADRMRNIVNSARDKLSEAQESQKLAADKNKQEANFRVGQQVYLSTKNLPLTYSNASDQRSRKLQDIFDGPFTIVKASRSPNAWYLDLPKEWNVRQPLNVSRFKRDFSDPTRERKPPPVKNSVYGAEYLVDSIVADELSGVERKYRIRWTGWGESDDTWEPIENLAGCKELVRKYHLKKGLGEPTWQRDHDRPGTRG